MKKTASQSTRRDFVRGALTTGLMAAPAVRPAWGRTSPNDRVNVAVVGFRNRGRDHYRNYSKIPNVRVAYLCDVDERLFPAAVAEVEKLSGHRPTTVVDFRRLIEKKDLDAVSIATPDYWHALLAVWACQAGKDVYVEKPISYTIKEGRAIVQAARKYNRMVQVGLQRRSSKHDRAGVRFVQEGRFGKAYRAQTVIFRGRLNIGHVGNSPVPKGVHWDLYRGPAPMVPFSLNRFHYAWHFHWDTSTTEVGNNGVHDMDLVRWAMQKHVHPVKVHCVGGNYIDDSDQDVPNTEIASYEYADGTLLMLEVTTLPSPGFGGAHMGSFFYTPKGYIAACEYCDRWKTVVGDFIPRHTPDPPSGISLRAANLSFPKIAYKPGPEIPFLDEKEVTHFENFIDCVRSRKREDLHAEALEGHMSTVLCHLANIAFRVGHTVHFDPETETFPGDEEANRYLTRTYRKPYVLPDPV